MKEITDEQYIAAAREVYAEDDIEFDADAKVSRGNGTGVFVQAWVWVYTDDVPPLTLPEE